MDCTVGFFTSPNQGSERALIQVVRESTESLLQMQTSDQIHLMLMVQAKSPLYREAL